MVSVLLGFFTSFVAWLVSHLPISPFASLTLGFNGFAGSGITVDTLMGWLNWLVPVQDMLLLFQAWCAAALLFVALKISTSPATKTVRDLTITG